MATKLKQRALKSYDHDQKNFKMQLCMITIQSLPNPLISPSESNLKCVEDYIRNEASQMDGFHAKSFNIQFNEKFKNHQCFVNFATTVQTKQASEIFNDIRIHDCQLKCKYNEPVKYKNEISFEIKVMYFSCQNLKLFYEFLNYLLL